VMTNNLTLSTVKAWVDSVVVELNLCPFAKRELARNRVRFVVTTARTETALLSALQKELELLAQNNLYETTLLIHPDVLQDFTDYNQFLQIADNLLQDQGLEGILQIASFHPDYQFADTEPDAAENYSNRSPFPMLHIINEESMELALAGYPNPEKIPERNIQCLKRLGKAKMEELLRSSFESR